MLTPRLCVRLSLSLSCSLVLSYSFAFTADWSNGKSEATAYLNGRVAGQFGGAPLPRDVRDHTWLGKHQDSTIDLGTHRLTGERTNSESTHTTWPLTCHCLDFLLLCLSNRQNVRCDPHVVFVWSRVVLADCVDAHEPTTLRLTRTSTSRSSHGGRTHHTRIITRVCQSNTTTMPHTRSSDTGIVRVESVAVLSGRDRCVTYLADHNAPHHKGCNRSAHAG
jgi:hypothetical protein